MNNFFYWLTLLILFLYAIQLTIDFIKWVRNKFPTPLPSYTIKPLLYHELAIATTTTKDPKLLLFLQQKYEYMHSDIWSTKRLATKTRDSFQCIICKSTYSLQVHRTKDYKLIPNEPISSLATLCAKCHTKQHEKHGFPQIYEDYMEWDKPIHT